MNQKLVCLLWIVALTLGASVYHFSKKELHHGELSSIFQRGDKISPSLQEVGIASVSLKAKDQAFQIKLQNENWVIPEKFHYPANLNRFGALLQETQNLTITQVIPATSEHWKRFGLDPNSESDYCEVSILGAEDKELFSFALGNRPYNGSGRYLRHPEDPNHVFIVEQFSQGINSSPLSFLDQLFLQVADPLTISMAAPNDSTVKPWTLTRFNPNHDFKIDQLPAEQTMNADESNGFRVLFSNMSFEDLMEKRMPAKDEANLRVLHLKTATGLQYQVSLWPVTPEKEDEAATHYYFNYEVSGQIHDQRVSHESETAEQKAALDAQHQTKVEALKANLEKVKSGAALTYKVAEWAVSSAYLNRGDLLQAKEESTQAEPSVPPLLTPPTSE